MGWSVYYQISEGEAHILRCVGDDSPLTIPEMIEGCPVTVIGPDCFGSGGGTGEEGLLSVPGHDLPPVSRENGTLRRISIPDSIRTIGDRAFARCRELHRMVLPKSLEKLGVRVFEQCGALEHMEIPEGITELPEYTFAHCRKLEWVTLPRGLTSIGKYCFYNCVILTGLDLPDEMKEVGRCLFMNCRNFCWLKGYHTINLGLILGELTGEIDLTVRFPDGEARLYLPDYAYEFEEVVMPRAFNTITYGSGQLYRECFSAKGVDFKLYESYFETALLKDKPAITVRIAWHRLRWPYRLERGRELYLKHIREQSKELMRQLLEQEDLEGLDVLLSMLDLTPEEFSALTDQAERAGKVRFVSRLMEAGMGLTGGADKEFDL